MPDRKKVKPTSIRLTQEGHDSLRALGREMGLTMGDVLETLIRQEMHRVRERKRRSLATVMRMEPMGGSSPAQGAPAPIEFDAKAAADEIEGRFG